MSVQSTARPAEPAPPPRRRPLHHAPSGRIDREWPEMPDIDRAALARDLSALHKDVTFVQANTSQGVGFWALVPLQQADGTMVIINRGFVEKKESYHPGHDADAPVELSGLLRISEPGGSRGRKNEPESERWFSRDVEAIARIRQLPPAQVAPYFIDADYNPEAGPGEPIGGLTIISFYNHHLVYVLTWYTLALMVAGATAYLLREERKKYKP